MIDNENEPTISVGLINGVEAIRFELKALYLTPDGALFNAGEYFASVSAGRIDITFAGERLSYQSSEVRLAPVDPGSSFVVRGVVIGIDFHWQREQDQEFRGALRIKLDADDKLIVINVINVESYLTSVISSEMSAGSNPELLKAHSIVSRSWLLAQMKEWGITHQRQSAVSKPESDRNQLIRWYDQENHLDFDVCADDHCQRYQGITKATTQPVFESVRSTFGQVLIYEGALCDARYSKSCGGMTERYDAAWNDSKVPYLAVSYDGESFPSRFHLPLSDEANAEAWIRNSPPAFCNTTDRDVLEKILPDFDRETIDFYRWRVVIEQDELQEMLRKKLGIDFGRIFRVEPVERGGSGRLIKLKITGERETIIIGKELEIRRALSRSHLYSSAFVIESDVDRREFKLIGAGWGHGVGLCQIGAAVMAERGSDHRRILAHYYRGAQLQTLYNI